MGKETVPIIKPTPNNGSTYSDVIPPVPVTGTYLAGVMIKPDSTLAADSTLDIIDPGAMTILHTSATSPQGEFSIPISVITKVVLNVRVKEGGGRFIFSDVRLPPDIVETLNSVRLAAGEKPIEGSLQNSAPAKAVASLERRLALQLPDNLIKNPVTDEKILVSEVKQAIIAFSLPANPIVGAKSVSFWSGVENRSTESYVRFSSKKAFDSPSSVKIVLSNSEIELSRWNGRFESMPAWPNRQAGDFVIEDFSRCTDPAVSGRPASGPLSASADTICGFTRSGSAFPNNEGVDYFIRLVGESDTEIKLSPVFRILSNNQPPRVNFGAGITHVAPPKRSLDGPRTYTRTITLSDEDSRVSCAESLSVSASNAELLSKQDFVIGGIVPNCSVTLKIGLGKVGKSDVTVLGTDGSLVSQYTFSVRTFVIYLEAGNVTGLSSVLKGVCDHTISQAELIPRIYPTDSLTPSPHTANISVRSATCVNGIYEVALHLPTGSEAFRLNLGTFGGDTYTITRTPFTCPAGYVGIPASRIAGLGSASATKGNANSWLDVDRDFCVMKFPARDNGSNTAVSNVSGLPWIQVQRGSEGENSTAFAYCAANGSGYRLMSNMQWQTVARHAESVPANWSGNSVGAGVLVRGHMDSNPIGILNIINEADPYDQSGNSTASGWDQRRTLILSNGDVVWDFAGHIKHWVSDDPTTLGISPAFPASFTEFSNLTYFSLGGINRLLFGPAGNFDGTHFAGRLLGGPVNSIIRGSHYSTGSLDAGMFFAELSQLPSTILPSNVSGAIGFRCSYTPP